MQNMFVVGVQQVSGDSLACDESKNEGPTCSKQPAGQAAGEEAKLDLKQPALPQQNP